jgi:hypothetical protein
MYVCNLIDQSHSIPNFDPLIWSTHKPAHGIHLLSHTLQNALPCPDTAGTHSVALTVEKPS